MTIVIKGKDGVRYPFGKPVTPEEEIEKLKKELEERDKKMKVHEDLIAELAMMIME